MDANKNSGEFEAVNLRTALVLNETVETRMQFFQNAVPFPVCPVRSMISPRLLGKNAVSRFPRTSEEVVQVKKLLKRLDQVRRTVKQFRNSLSEFHTLDFFEYVIRCRMEYNSNFKI